MIILYTQTAEEEKVMRKKKIRRGKECLNLRLQRERFYAQILDTHSILQHVNTSRKMRNDERYKTAVPSEREESDRGKD